MKDKNKETQKTEIPKDRNNYIKAIYLKNTHALKAQSKSCYSFGPA